MKRLVSLLAVLQMLSVVSVGAMEQEFARITHYNQFEKIIVRNDNIYIPVFEDVKGEFLYKWIMVPVVSKDDLAKTLTDSFSGSPYVKAVCNNQNVAIFFNMTLADGKPAFELDNTKKEKAYKKLSLFQNYMQPVATTQTADSVQQTIALSEDVYEYDQSRLITCDDESIVSIPVLVNKEPRILQTALENARLKKINSDLAIETIKGAEIVLTGLARSHIKQLQFNTEVNMLVRIQKFTKAFKRLCSDFDGMATFKMDIMRFGDIKTAHEKCSDAKSHKAKFYKSIVSLAQDSNFYAIEIHDNTPFLIVKMQMPFSEEQKPYKYRWIAIPLQVQSFSSRYLYEYGSFFNEELVTKNAEHYLGGTPTILATHTNQIMTIGMPLVLYTYVSETGPVDEEVSLIDNSVMQKKDEWNKRLEQIFEEYFTHSTKGGYKKKDDAKKLVETKKSPESVSKKTVTNASQKNSSSFFTPTKIGLGCLTFLGIGCLMFYKPEIFKNFFSKIPYATMFKGFFGKFSR